MKYILDTSVIIKLFFLEKGSMEAMKLMQMGINREVELLASDLIFYEVGNVIWKNLRKTGDDGREHIKKLAILLIDYVALDDKLMMKSMEVAQENDITYYDAVHVALAELRKSYLITEDKKLLNTFKSAINIKQALEPDKLKQ